MQVRRVLFRLYGSKRSLGNHIVVYRSKVLGDGTDFTVIGIVGRTGSGKSTLASDLLGWDSANPVRMCLYSVVSVIENLQCLRRLVFVRNEIRFFFLVVESVERAVLDSSRATLSDGVTLHERNSSRR